jgi:hypothetical protein
MRHWLRGGCPSKMTVLKRGREFAGDAMPDAILEVRAYEDSRGRKRLSLATWSDLPTEAQVTANGATWLSSSGAAKHNTTKSLS